MNERIKELLEQAGVKYVVMPNDTVYEKFAELIVREMCDVFDKRAEPGTGFYEPHEPAELIKQHFGVEE